MSEELITLKGGLFGNGCLCAFNLGIKSPTKEQLRKAIELATELSTPELFTCGDRTGNPTGDGFTYEDG